MVDYFHTDPQTFIILFLISLLFFATIFLMGKFKKRKHVAKGRIIIGTSKKREYISVKTSSGIYIRPSNDVEGVYCSLCGYPLWYTPHGSPVKCINNKCSRWYHTKCIEWAIEHGRLRCSCGSFFPSIAYYERYA